MNLESLNQASDGIQTPNEYKPAEVAAPLQSDPQDELLQLAQHRNLEALTTLIDQRFAEQAIKVADIEFKDDLLQLSVESSDVPAQSVVVPLLRDYLSQLRLPSIARVTIYGQKLGQELPFWMEEIALDLLILDPPPPNPHNTAEVSSENAGQTGADIPLPEPVALPSEIALDLTARYEAGERNFAQINLKDAALPGIVLTLADLQKANLVWCDLRKSSLSHANLTSAQLRHADLTEANLQGAKLQGTDLQGAKLRGANLSWAVLRGTNLTDADLTDVNFQNATLERVIMPDGTILD
ncbi:pentapeptide repeat-containing protein [Acaryochloris sp. IP29b_bin.137]|uniref:pentapeptide repeat-containing protein n=1 Tax=Acaryochloris sp. IP29b_bin.137 TaxID=2969217 RepID=UPI00261BE12C|nr:pentapeptide repeat-containing protein [Acaryochloris sp. IP29b_bin.137]